MITLVQARKALEASEAKARQFGITVSTVIVDANGLIIAASRMDNSLPISPRFAYAKAYTAAVLRMPSAVLEEYAVPGKPYYGITAIFGGEFTTIPGGYPVAKNNRVIGGIGVGGGEPSQDEACAKEALKVLEE